MGHEDNDNEKMNGKKSSIVHDYSKYGATETSSVAFTTANSMDITSDAASSSSLESSGDAARSPSFEAPSVYKYIPSFFRFDDAPSSDATGLSLDFYARAGVVMSTIVLGPALLQLSTISAGCTSSPYSDPVVDPTSSAADDDAMLQHSFGGDGAGTHFGMGDSGAADCENRVNFWGFIHIKPSSLLTNIASASRAITALTMPLVGAIVDYTPHRKAVGVWTAVGVSLCMGINAIISLETWMWVATVQIIGFFLYNAHIVVTYAYTSELSKDPRELTKFNSHFFVVFYAGILAFCITCILLAAFVFHTRSNVGTARISQGVAFLTSALYFGFAWTYLFHSRPASSQWPQNNNANNNNNANSNVNTGPRGVQLLTAGFIKLWNTACHIAGNLPQLRFLMYSVMCSEAATASLVSFATTFMVEFLGMEIVAVATTYGLILLMGIPGAKIGEWIALQTSPRTSALSALVFFMVTTFLAAIILNGPHRARYMKYFGMCWGTGLGWLHPINTTMFITLTPTHSQTEYMGIYNFSQSVIGWLPPLVFTLLNEHGLPMNVGLASINCFFFTAFLFLLCMGPISGRRPGLEDDDNVDGTIVFQKQVATKGEEESSLLLHPYNDNQTNDSKNTIRTIC